MKNRGNMTTLLYLKFIIDSFHADADIRYLKMSQLCEQTLRYDLKLSQIAVNQVHA